VRIVHQFYSRRASSSGSGDHYATKITAKPPKKMPGFQVDILAVDASKDGEEGDALHIEGDGAAVKAMLTDLLRVVRCIEDDCRKSYARHRSKTKQCRTCKAWVSYKHSCGRFKKVVAREKRKMKSPQSADCGGGRLRASKPPTEQAGGEPGAVQRNPASPPT
jgi:hypothetical protein